MFRPSRGDQSIAPRAAVIRPATAVKRATKIVHEFLKKDLTFSINVSNIVFLITIKPSVSYVSYDSGYDRTSDDPGPIVIIFYSSCNYSTGSDSSNRDRKSVV